MIVPSIYLKGTDMLTAKMLRHGYRQEVEIWLPRSGYGINPGIRVQLHLFWVPGRYVVGKTTLNGVWVQRSFDSVVEARKMYQTINKYPTTSLRSEGE